MVIWCIPLGYNSICRKHIPQPISIGRDPALSVTVAVGTALQHVGFHLYARLSQSVHTGPELSIEGVAGAITKIGGRQVCPAEFLHVRGGYAEPPIERVDHTAGRSIGRYLIQSVGDIAAVQGCAVYFTGIVQKLFPS